LYKFIENEYQQKKMKSFDHFNWKFKNGIKNFGLKFKI